MLILFQIIIQKRVVDEYRLWAACLYALPGVGPRRYRELLARYGHPRKAWEAAGGKGMSAAELAEMMEEGGWRIVMQEEEGYPPLLRHVEDAPPLLYWKGRGWPGKRPGVAVVGSRRADGYSLLWGEKIGHALAAAGMVVVSGMARGVDLAAHLGALKAGGYTLGFLGQGAARELPPSRARVAEKVAARGGLATEFAPHLPPLPGHFPARNRLIAGSCIAVVVVSAASRSGALITAGQAGDYGREVFCLPHRIDSPLFAGVRKLLEEGARMITSLEQLVEELVELASRFAAPDSPFEERPGPAAVEPEPAAAKLDGDLAGRAVALGKQPEPAAAKQPKPAAAEREPAVAKLRSTEAVLSTLGPLPLWPEEIARESGLPLPLLLTLLWELEKEGKIRRFPGGAYGLAETV